MDLDKNLVTLQGTLYSFGKQGLLNNPDTLHQVLKGIREVTENAPDATRSKLTFLMVLCTRLSVSEKLKDDIFVGQYINSEPYFEKEYLIIYIYHLKLQSELFRVIENCPGALGLELLEEVIEKLKEPNFKQVEFGQEHFYNLWQSIFVKLCKISKGLHKENCTEKLKTYFLEVYEFLQQLLIASMTDDSELAGLHLYYFFKALLFCIKLQKTQNVSDDPLYELSVDFEQKEEHVCCNTLINCIGKVFQKISNILKNLTVDMWMFFSECYCREDPSNSVQVLIGDLVYNILNEVNERREIYNVPSDVLSFMSSISINKSDLIAKAGIEEVICHVKNGEKEWFKALARHSDIKMKESLECLFDQLEIADSNDLGVILNTLYEYLNSVPKDENLDLIKKLFLKALKMTPDYEEWLMKIFEKYQSGLLTTAETNEDLIETFNKISKGNSILHSDLISLCVQSPLETIKKICHIAVYGSEQTKFATETLKLLKCPSNMPHLEGFTLLDHVLLKFLLEDLTDKDKHSFIDLVLQLGKENLLGSSFHSNLLKCLKEYLENEILEKGVLCLEIVNAILKFKIFEFHKAAFLVFMSQVLGHFTWDLKSFSIIKADGREQADGVVSLVINSLEEKDCSDYQWARQEILKSWEINQAYFCDLWFKFNANWSGSGTFSSLILALAHSRHKLEDVRTTLINFDQPFEVRTSIVLTLTMLLPVLAFQRWNSIFHQLIIAWRSIDSEKQDVYHDVLDFFGTALQILGMNLSRQEDTYPCYKYCLRNFGKLAKQYCPKMTEESLVRVFEKIFLFLGEIEDEEKRKSCWEIFPPLLMDLIEELRKKNAVEVHRDRIEKLLPFLDLKNVADGLMKKLQ